MAGRTISWQGRGAQRYGDNCSARNATNPQDGLTCRIDFSGRIHSLSRCSNAPKRRLFSFRLIQEGT